MPTELVPFLVVVAVVTVTPGPDMAMVLRNGVRGGTSTAWHTGLGCCCGIAVHATAAVLGLSALLAASALAFTVVKLAGAAYLVYLGARTLLATLRRTRGTEPPPEQEQPRLAPAAGGSAFRQGLLTNLLNPKIALLFLTLLPQFVTPGESRVTTSAELAGAFLVVAVLWMRGVSFAVGALSRLLARGRVRTWLDRVTGTVLVALGLRVAFE